MRRHLIVALAGLLLAGTVARADESANRHDGLVLRAAPMIMVDGASCIGALYPTEEPPSDKKACSSAWDLVVELGIQYRWALASGNALSLGVAFNTGAVLLNGDAGPQFSGAVGVIFPRL